MSAYGEAAVVQLANRLYLSHIGRCIEPEVGGTRGSNHELSCRESQSEVKGQLQHNGGRYRTREMHRLREWDAQLLEKVRRRE